MKLQKQKAEILSPPPTQARTHTFHRIAFSHVAYLEFGGWRHGGHKSHCYWCGYEPQPNGDDSVRSFSSVFPLQRWALDTVHLTCHFPAIQSAICTEPIRTRRTFNFICSSTLQGFFLFSGHCLAQCGSLFQGLLPCLLCCVDCSQSSYVPVKAHCLVNRSVFLWF